MKKTISLFVVVISVFWTPCVSDVKKPVVCVDGYERVHQEGDVFTIRERGQLFECTCTQGLERCQELCVDRTDNFFGGGKKGCKDIKAKKFPCTSYEKDCCQTCEISPKCRDERDQYHESGTQYTVHVRSRTMSCSCTNGLELCQEVCADRPGNILTDSNGNMRDCSYLNEVQDRCNDLNTWKSCCITCSKLI